MDEERRAHMDEEISALLITAVERLTVPEDKRLAVFHMRNDAGPVHLAVTVDQLQGLLIATLQAMSHIQRDQMQSSVSRFQQSVLPVEWWEFGMSDDKQHLVLSFRVEGGATIAFRVHPSVAPLMQEGLASTLGQGPTTPQGTPKQ